MDGPQVGPRRLDQRRDAQAEIGAVDGDERVGPEGDHRLGRLADSRMDFHGPHGKKEILELRNHPDDPLMFMNHVVPSLS